jgi:uncharacterized damage-inducible protein DinB
MSEAKRIRRQLETAFRGPAWHGPSLMENLAGVTAEVAASKPVANAHSIWEIVSHLAAWQKAVISVMDGSSYVMLTGDADWPPVEGKWEDAVAELESSHAAIIERLESATDERLKENLPGVDYSWRVFLWGIAAHSLYHAGQIGLLKRAVG